MPRPCTRAKGIVPEQSVKQAKPKQSKNTVESTSENTREREEVDWENSQWLASFPALDPLEEDVEGHIEDL